MKPILRYIINYQKTIEEYKGEIEILKNEISDLSNKRMILLSRVERSEKESEKIKEENKKLVESFEVRLFNNKQKNSDLLNKTIIKNNELDMICMKNLT